MTEPQPPPSDKPRRRWWVASSIAVLFVVLVGGVFLWATSTPDPDPVALDALQSDEQVRVTEADGYTFEPAAGASVGFILYPGGRVDPASYAAPARAIAEAGYLVVVPELTLNLAVLDANAADAIIASHPTIETWVIGGHSLGGSMAARYAADRAEAIDGLVMWAAYPAESNDLSSLEMAAASVFGTRDGLTSTAEIQEARGRLPVGTEFVSIIGGNHAQFGDYGPQDGDNPASISREEQQARAVDATLRVLEAVS